MVSPNTHPRSPVFLISLAMVAAAGCRVGDGKAEGRKTVLGALGRWEACRGRGLGRGWKELRPEPFWNRKWDIGGAGGVPGFWPEYI